MATNYDVTLKFILDQAAQARVEKGVSTLAEELAKVGVSMDEIKGAKFGDAVAAEVDKAAKATKDKLNPALEQTANRIKKANAEAALLRKEVAAMSSDLEQARISSLRSAAGFLEGLGRSALAGGAALSGGIFLAAKNYIKDAEKSDELTRKWASSTQEIVQAQERIGRVAARAVLPTLQKAAEIASMVASFTESHPEIVQAAFNTGLLVAGFGALAIAVSKGVKLVADIKYLATIPVQLEAARLQDRAATKQLEAAGLRLKELGVPNAGTVAQNAASKGTSLLSLGPLAAILSGAAAYTALGRGAANFGAKQFGFESPEDFWKKMLIQLDLVQAEADGAADGLAKVAGAVASVSFNPAKDQAIVDAWSKWQEDDARIVAEAAEQRVKIVADAEKRVSAETARYADQVSKINAAAAKRTESLTSNFLKADAKAEADYQEQRAKIIRDGGKEVRRIEEDHQERLRKLIREHEERVEDLTASRDALGLAKEARRFNEAKAEEARGTREEIAQRRQDLAERLQELDREHKIEQAQRLAQFQEALAENEAQRKEDLKQAAIAHAEELKQIREQRAAQLRELVETLNAERLRRREMFIAQVRDLDASLLGERNLKVRYYNLMLSDADRWLAEYRRKLSSVSTASPPTHDFTGYAYSGLYRMAANGQPEYVLSGAATRAAEQIIGGKLTQDALLSAMVRGAAQGGSRTLTYNDQRRFNASVPLSERRAIVRETADAIAQEFRR